MESVPPPKSISWPPRLPANVSPVPVNTSAPPDEATDPESLNTAATVP
jgi:hypothetical protein